MQLGLIIASLTFYGCLSAQSLPLLFGSIGINFLLGEWLARSAAADRGCLLWLGIGFNLALLGYYKYAGFVVETLDTSLGLMWLVPVHALPPGISFFTFLQITYLVDIYRREPVDRDLVGYALFVSFFPHLLAGPIIHHREMMPQFADAKRFRFSLENIAVGLSMFSIGLAKKTLIADGMGKYVAEVFGAAAKGYGIEPAMVWFGALAFTFQLYFDFSGYSDMAIGLARLFGIRFPQNFNSPYKAWSLVDFWRRWHMTLSRFLRDYVYIPLGGNRCGRFRQSLNLLATMLLAGVWHGAGWTYIVWGGVHGVGLLINHSWNDITKSVASLRSRPAIAAAWLTTFVFVAAAWVLFRADNLKTAASMLHGMFLWQPTPGPCVGLNFRARHWANLPLMLVVILFCPNTREIMGFFDPVLAATPPPTRRWWHLRLTPAWGVVVALLFATAVLNLGETQEFIYYRF